MHAYIHTSCDIHTCMHTQDTRVRMAYMFCVCHPPPLCTILPLSTRTHTHCRASYRDWRRRCETKRGSLLLRLLNVSRSLCDIPPYLPYCVLAIPPYLQTHTYLHTCRHTPTSLLAPLSWIPPYLNTYSSTCVNVYANLCICMKYIIYIHMHIDRHVCRHLSTSSLLSLLAQRHHLSLGHTCM
jgi:hypothetical protein